MNARFRLPVSNAKPQRSHRDVVIRRQAALKFPLASWMAGTPLVQSAWHGHAVLGWKRKDM
jgi:hypothetical protein